MGRQRTETGAISVLLAALSLGLVLLTLAGANAAGLIGVRREAQRAANLSALAGAANLPLVGLFASPEPHTTSCAQIDKSFAPSSALLTPELGGGAVPACGAGVTVSAQIDWLRVDAARDALALLIQSADFPADLCEPIEVTPPNPLLDLPGVSTLIDPALAGLTDLECAELSNAVHGLPDNLSPATITPRVHVSVQGEYEAFVPMPAFAGQRAVDAEATARRRFKNVVVLPAVNGAPQPLNDLNPTATEIRDTLLPAAEQAAAELAAAVAPFMPPGIGFDLSGLFVDLYDIYDPPTAAPAPSPLDVAEAAVESGEPVVLLRLFDMPVLGIPALDFTAAYLSRLADGSFQATPIPVGQLSAASGLFAASLVRPLGVTP